MRYHFSTADVLLLTFDLSNHSSLEGAKRLKALANVYYGQYCKVPAVLVGTKSDLEADREISFEEGLATANELGCSYVETSAAMNINISEAFRTAVELAVRNLMQQSLADLKCIYSVERKEKSAKKSVKGLLRSFSIRRKNISQKHVHTLSE